MSKAKIGFLQELQGDGSVANSLMRLLEVLAFTLLCAYTSIASFSYEWHFNAYVQLLRDKCITEQSFIVLTNSLKRIDWDVFLILMVGTFAPKAIQKFAEAKIGMTSNTVYKATPNSV